MPLQLTSIEFDFLIGAIDSVLEKTTHTFDQQPVSSVMHEKTDAEALHTWEEEGGAVRLNFPLPAHRFTIPITDN